MKLENLKENNNKLLERKEISALIIFEGATPKRETVKKELCVKIGANPDLCVLKAIDTHYGSNKLRATLHAYENEEKMKELEAGHYLKRGGMIKEEKKEEKPKEEKPAEKKEEKKPKEKKEGKKEEPKKKPEEKGKKGE